MIERIPARRRTGWNLLTAGKQRMAIDDKLLERLICPENHQPLRVADETIVAQVNAAIARGTLHNRAGRQVSTPLDAGLLRADGAVMYAVCDGIPLMIADEGIPIDQLS